MRKSASRIRTLLILSTLALLLAAMPALAVPPYQCGGYSYVACNGDHVTVIELCSGDTVKVINGELTLYDDSTWEVDEADRVEIQPSDGSPTLVIPGPVQICRQ